ncbi:MAG: type II secretion system GspH family protein [Heliobacteriaceae bacterium]|jgi:prepilin-type N-terminal cleavage/methylation domain-containing protein|nr:type II secretion system GspH family protein [Heliobacteriaceae bacterium]
MKNAFTLAEVLITLGIIGVVAALTMPALIAKHKEKQTVVKLKKVYSTLSNAVMLAVNENGTPDEWTDTEWFYLNDTITDALLEKLLPYLRVSKYCGRMPCGANYSVTMLNGDGWGPMNAGGHYGGIFLQDGTYIRAFAQGPFGVYVVDVNEKKPPNVLGKDVFRFQIDAKGKVMPVGMGSLAACKLSSNGYGCAAWVIFNENMDYLHCDDLSWNGKTKCD